MLSSSHPKIHEPLVTGVSPRPHGPATAPETAKTRGVSISSAIIAAGRRAPSVGTGRYATGRDGSAASASPIDSGVSVA